MPRSIEHTKIAAYLRDLAVEPDPDQSLLREYTWLHLPNTFDVTCIYLIHCAYHMPYR